MKENAEELKDSKPEQSEDLKAVEETDTTPEQTQEITIPIKFNKEIKNLTVNEAANLAQKGMKFDVISPDYERLKELAGRSGTTVPDFISALERRQNDERKQRLIEECGGNNKIAERILELENISGKTLEKGLKEITEKFPHIKDIDSLPEQVVENARLKGTNLLDEFLRFKLEKEIEKKEILSNQKKGEQQSIGSQNSTSGRDAATTEFLRGLWG